MHVTSTHVVVFIFIFGSRDSSVIIVTRLRAGWSGGRISSGGKRFFLFSKTFRPALGTTQPPIKWVPASFPGDVTTRHHKNRLRGHVLDLSGSG